MTKDKSEHLKGFYFGAANHIYNPADYNMTNEFLQGLTATHQQISGSYAEGTIESTANAEQ